MQVTTLLSVVSSAVVVAALSSSVVQLQPTGVLVAPAPAPVAAPADTPPAASAVPAPAPGRPARPVAAPARPAYVQVPTGERTLSLSAATSGGAAAPTVDVLACTTEWSEAGECLGRQVAVVREVAVRAVGQAVEVPEDSRHLRVSVHGGQVSVSGASTGAVAARP